MSKKFQLQNRSELQPLTVAEIVRAMNDTYQSCAHDVLSEDGPEEWPGSAVLDFVVSNYGCYADRWDHERYQITPRSTKDAAVASFNRSYGYSE